jgi:hypothetical protein
MKDEGGREIGERFSLPTQDIKSAYFRLIYLGNCITQGGELPRYLSHFS